MLQNFFKYSELIKGATINIEMCKQVNKKCGADPNDFLYSFSNE